jgi:hypothetical protein
MERRGGGDPTKTAEWLDVRATRSGPSSDKHHLVVGAKGSGDNGLRTMPQSTYIRSGHVGHDVAACTPAAYFCKARESARCCVTQTVKHCARMAMSQIIAEREKRSV